MDPEERFERIERQNEFTANHLAQLSIRMDRHQEQIERQDEQIARHSEQIARHSEQIAQLGDFLVRTGRLLEDLARRTDGRFEDFAKERERSNKESDERFRRLDERLNILIAVVERYFSNGGKAN